MTRLVEGNLVLDARNAQNAFKIDVPEEKFAYYDFAIVDFVIELRSHIVFVELKDPDDPSAKYHTDRKKFVDKFTKKKFNEKFLRKFRDSFFVLYSYCLNRKPLIGVALIVSEEIGKPERQSVADNIAHRAPIFDFAPEGWECCPFEKIWVLGFDEWNYWFAELPVFRNV